MVWSLQRAEPCVVHPATEAYAQEAIIAIKSEKVIAGANRHSLWICL